MKMVLVIFAVAFLFYAIVAAGAAMIDEMGGLYAEAAARWSRATFFLVAAIGVLLWYGPPTNQGSERWTPR